MLEVPEFEAPLLRAADPAGAPAPAAGAAAGDAALRRAGDRRRRGRPVHRASSWRATAPTCCWRSATRPAWRPARRMPAACTCSCCRTISTTKARRTAARQRTPCRSAPRSIALWREIAAEAGEDLGIRTEGGLMLAETAAGLAWLRAQVGDGAALGHRKPRARRQRTARAGAGAVGTHSSAPTSFRPRATAIRCAAPWRC